MNALRKNILWWEESLRDKCDYCNNSIKVTITREETKENKINIAILIILTLKDNQLHCEYNLVMKL